MPWPRPKLSEIETRINSDLRSRQSDERYPRQGDVAQVFGAALAGAAHLLHAHIEYGIKQALPSTATDSFLDEHAWFWLRQKRKPAAYAQGVLVFKGVNGTVLAAGSEVVSSAGVSYFTQAAVVVKDGQLLVAVTAKEAGSSGNLQAGAGVALFNSVIGLELNGVVNTGGIDGGVDVESDAELQARIVARMKSPPHGGSASDYVAWALEVAGVTRAWVRAKAMGENSVVVVFVRDNDADIVPDALACAQVQAHLDSVRPVTATVYAVAPVPKPVAYKIRLRPDSIAARAAVEQSLQAMHIRDGDLGKELQLSRIVEAISVAVGEESHDLLLPLTNIAVDALELPVFGGVQWVD